jgi:hypothetical protein
MLTRISTHSRLSIAASIFILFFIVGCRKPYPQLPREQLKFVQGIRTAANTRSKQRVDAVGEAIKKALDAGEIPPELEKILTSLLEECYSENYDEAEKKCVLLLKDQLRK